MKYTVSALFSLALLSSGVALAEDGGDPLVERGFAISPIPEKSLKISPRERDRVGLGSFIVNAIGDCSGCHSFPQFLPKGDASGSNPAADDPYNGVSSTQPTGEKPIIANFNVQHYLAGGQCFGPFQSRNLTPDANGLPVGLTEAEFIRVLRTGEDVACDKNPSDPICALGPPTPLLQVMPWPTYHNMTDEQLRAIYAYLSSLPPASPCNTVANGCPGYSGAAANSASYAYQNSASCPNPAPPQ